jgi:hypothetical protein
MVRRSPRLNKNLYETANILINLSKTEENVSMNISEKKTAKKRTRMNITRVPDDDSSSDYYPSDEDDENYEEDDDPTSDYYPSDEDDENYEEDDDPTSDYYPSDEENDEEDDDTTSDYYHRDDVDKIKQTKSNQLLCFSLSLIVSASILSICVI